MTAQECTEYRNLYYKAVMTPEYARAIAKAEQTIIKDMPYEDCASIVVVLREKK